MMINLSFLMIGYLVVINLITLFLFWRDKRRSKKAKWRTPEKTLLGFCAIGGSLGGLLGMYWFHHKTKHWLFALGIPLLFCLQVALGIFLAWKF